MSGPGPSSARKRHPGEARAAVEEGLLELLVVGGGIGAELAAALEVAAADQPPPGRRSPRATPAFRRPAAAGRGAGPAHPGPDPSRVDGVGADLGQWRATAKASRTIAELGVRVRLLAVPTPPRMLEVVEVDAPPGLQTGGEVDEPCRPRHQRGEQVGGEHVHLEDALQTVDGGLPARRARRRRRCGSPRRTAPRGQPRRRAPGSPRARRDLPPRSRRPAGRRRAHRRRASHRGRGRRPGDPCRPGSARSPGRCRRSSRSPTRCSSRPPGPAPRARPCRGRAQRPRRLFSTPATMAPWERS